MNERPQSTTEQALCQPMVVEEPRVKFFEVRDRGACISAIAIRLQPASEAERWLLERAGYGRTPEEQAEYILLGDVDNGYCRLESDPGKWFGNSTMQTAHEHIAEFWAELPSGSVICTEYLRGERDEPKKTDRPGGGS